MKKLFAVLIALIIALTAGSTAGAGTITINEAAGQSAETEEYRAYKILTADDTGKVYSIDKSSPWFSVLDSPNQIWLNLASAASEPDTYFVTEKDGLNGTDDEIAKALAEYLEDSIPSGESGTMLTAGSNAVDNGYYLITSTAGSALVLDTCGDVVLTEKNDYPTLSLAADSESATIGTSVAFTLTLTVPSTVTSDITVHAVLTQGFTLEGDISAKVGENTITYSKISDMTDGCSFELVFARDDVAGKTVAITYDARLNKSARVWKESNTNKAWLTYSKFESVASEAAVNTYSLSFKKVDGADNAKTLSGAEFQLKNSDGTLIDVVESGNGAYRVADATETEYATIRTSDSGIVTINGLAGRRGTNVEKSEYSLVETKAPSGYNLMSSATPVEIRQGNIAADSVIIANNTGSALPSTGGIGTAIFYIIGGLLMVGALAVFVARKKVGAGKR